MRSSTSHFDLRIPPSRLRAWWNAWYAVNDRTPLDVFLRWRLRIYQALYRRSHYPPPFEVVITKHGEVIQIPNPTNDTFWDQLRDNPNGEDAADLYKTQSMSQEIARTIEEIEDKVARLNHVGHGVREQLEEVVAEQVERIGRGEMEGPRTRKRRNERRRPRLPFPWVPVAGYLALVLLILCETYQFALPLLDWIGVDTSNLHREWKRNPLGVLNGAGFALAASAGLFFLWHRLICAAVTLSRSWELAGPFVIARRVAGIVLLSCALLVGSILMANMRHGTIERTQEFQAIQHDQAAGTAMGTGVFVFLTLLVPCTAAALHSAIGQSSYWQRRRDTAAQQVQFDREEDARLVPAEMVADRLALLEHRRDTIEHERTRLQNERRALAGRAIAAEQARLEKLEQARWCTLVYAQSLLAALEQDRYFFLRAANRSKAFHLLPDAARVHEHERTPPRQFVHPLLTAASNGQRV